MASGDMTSRRVKRALFFIPALALLGALSWPTGAGLPGATPAVADTCLDPLNVLCVPTTPTPSPSASLRPSPPHSPTPSPRLSPRPSSGSTTPPGGPTPGGTDNGAAVGAAPAPPAPPPVPPTGIGITSEPADPQPGSVATLVITVSGQNGVDRYGVAGVNVSLTLKDQPGADANLDSTNVVTDASGAATARLTLSQTRGRHVVDATTGTLSSEWTADTLAGANQLSRGRHGGEIDTTTPATRGNAPVFFVAGGVVFVLGFVWPYLLRWLSHRGLRLGSRVPAGIGLRTSSKRTS